MSYACMLFSMLFTSNFKDKCSYHAVGACDILNDFTSSNSGNIRYLKYKRKGNTTSKCGVWIQKTILLGISEFQYTAKRLEHLDTSKERTDQLRGFFIIPIEVETKNFTYVRLKSSKTNKELIHNGLLNKKYQGSMITLK